MNIKNEITNDLIEKNLMKLYEFGNQSIQCDSCQSLESCKNLMQGYYPKLVFSRGAQLKFITINVQEK